MRGTDIEAGVTDAHKDLLPGLFCSVDCYFESALISFSVILQQHIKHADAVGCAGGIGGAFRLTVQFVDDGLYERHGDMLRDFESVGRRFSVLDEADPFEARAFEDQGPFRTDDRHFIQSKSAT